MRFHLVEIDGSVHYNPGDLTSYKLMTNHSPVYKSYLVSWCTAGWAKRHNLGIL